MSDRTDWIRVLRDALDGNVAGNAALERLLAADAAETQTLRERLADAQMMADEWKDERDAAVAEAKVFEETSDFWEAQTSASNAKWTEAVADRDRLADTLDVVLGYVNRRTLVTVICEDVDDVLGALDDAEQTLAALAGREGGSDDR